MLGPTFGAITNYKPFFLLRLRFIELHFKFPFSKKVAPGSLPAVLNSYGRAIRSSLASGRLEGHMLMQRLHFGLE